MYVIQLDQNCSTAYCVEVASSGGDGGDSYESFSTIQGDTIFRTKLVKTVMIDKISR